MQPLGLLKLQGTGHGAEDLVGDPVDVALLQAHVPLGADAGQDGDLFSPQAGYAARASAPLEPRLLRGDLGAPRGQELADLGSVVHDTNVTSAHRGRGVALGPPITATPYARAITGYLE